MKNFLFSALLFYSVCVSAQNKDSSDFYFAKGQVEKAAGHWLIAHNNFLKAIAFDKTSIPPLLEDGSVALEMRKTDIAKDNFSKALSLDPGDTTAIKELSSLYFNYRQFDKAIEMAKLCKGCADAERIIGLSLYEKENYPEAVKSLIAALNTNAADAVATYTLGRAYLDMEEYKKAIPVYEKAIALDATKNTWQYELGLVYFNLNDYKNAKLMFETAAKNGYVQSNDYNENLGYSSLYVGDFEQGETLLMSVWNRKPGNKDILRDLAEILYQKQQFDKSLQYCQKLLELDAKDGKALYQAGLCFIKKGQKEKGQQMCDKAINIDPSLEGLRKKKEMVGM